MFRIASICLLGYWLAIFIATHLPAGSMPNLHWSDKVYHAGAFCGLAFLLAWALPSSHRIKHACSVSIIAMGYAGIDEFTQKFIPGRHCDVWDFAADCGGVVLGLIAYAVCREILSSMSWGRKLIQGLSR